jgi:uncharacterized membrane protein
METPTWALWLAYWLHMLATVVWIGGLAALSILVLPAARQALDAPGYATFISRLQRRFDPIGWFCLAILAGTGMFQMSASPSYQGFLSIENRWAAAILVKHVLFMGMAGLSAYLTWGLMPRMRRLALRRAVSETADEGEARRLAAQETRLLQLNLLLGVLVLALTAIARAS